MIDTGQKSQQYTCSKKWKGLKAAGGRREALKVLIEMGISRQRDR